MADGELRPGLVFSSVFGDTDENEADEGELDRLATDFVVTATTPAEVESLPLPEAELSPPEVGREEAAVAAADFKVTLSYPYMSMISFMAVSAYSCESGQGGSGRFKVEMRPMEMSSELGRFMLEGHEAIYNYVINTRYKWNSHTTQSG